MSKKINAKKTTETTVAPAKPAVALKKTAPAAPVQETKVVKETADEVAQREANLKIIPLGKPITAREGTDRRRNLETMVAAKNVAEIKAAGITSAWVSWAIREGYFKLG